MTPTGFLQVLCERISEQAGAGILRVAITGVDGVGKTCLADVLATRLGQTGHDVIRAGIDGFHNPRAQRYARGRDSPEGFFRGSIDLPALHRVLLDPLSPGGDGRYRTIWFDHVADKKVETKTQVAPARAILIFDGIFLMQPALLRYWDLTIFLKAPFAATFARLAARDGTDPDPDAASNRRYRDGQVLYMNECDPEKRADILVDYTDLDNPVILKG